MKGNRKFYFGDEIAIVDIKYKKHLDHHGIVTWIWSREKKVKHPYLVYEIECECGKMLMLRSSFMVLVEERVVTEQDSVMNRNKRRFVRQLNMQPRKSVEQLDKQIERIFRNVSDRDRSVLVDRYNLYSEKLKPKTYRDIAKDLGLTFQRVEQIEKRLIQSMRATKEEPDEANISN